jgi:endonuclease/exonuclease/phosphatase family metal-dependent hydrolase
LRILTYNIHSCIGRFGRCDTERTAAIIEEFGPDAVALQEVDAGMRRTARLDQAGWLADRLGMRHFAHPLIEIGGGTRGLAVLSKHPMTAIKMGRLPAFPFNRVLETRGAMWVRLETPKGRVDLINTHLGLNARERGLQIRSLLGKGWIGRVEARAPLVFCGDFNAGPRSRVYRKVSALLQDVQTADSAPGAPKATFISFYPVFRIDHIFVSRHFSPVRVMVPVTPLTRAASDHLPVVAELALRRTGGKRHKHLAS